MVEKTMMRVTLILAALFLFGCGVGGEPLYPEGGAYPREYPLYE